MQGSTGAGSGASSPHHKGKALEASDVNKSHMYVSCPLNRILAFSPVHALILATCSIKLLLTPVDLHAVSGSSACFQACDRACVAS